jgi:hypothetical protein
MHSIVRSAVRVRFSEETLINGNGLRDVLVGQNGGGYVVVDLFPLVADWKAFGS